MKKLLTIFSSFGIIMSSSLSIISCSTSDEQKAIDKAIEQLKNQTINVTVADGDHDTVKKAIKDNSDFKSKIADLNIKIETIELTQNNKEFKDDFKNSESYEVTLKIKKENTAKRKKAEGKAKFKIKVIFLTDEEKVNATVAKLNAIASNTEIGIESTEVTVSELKNEIKNLQEYTNVIGKHGVNLEGDLILEKITNTVLADTDTIFINDSITVKGKVKAGTIEKNFTFTVKVKTKTDQQKVDEAVAKLNAITSSTEIWLEPDTATGAELKTK